LLELDHVVMVAAFDNKRASVETTIKPVDKVHRQTHLGDPIVIFISVVIVAVLVFLVFWWPAESTTNVASNTQEALVVETVDQVKAPALVDPIADESNENEQNTESTALDSTPINTASAVVEVETPKVEVAAQEVSQPIAPKPVAPEVEVVKAAKPVVQAKEASNDVVTGLSAETVAILKEAGVSPDEVVRATKVVPVVETPAVVAKLDDIEIAFGEDCWAEIRDASGTILFSGVQSAGSTLFLTGDAPYRVVLGYAKGVSSLKYKGELFDFSPFTRKDLARFELK
jgi:cytoskeleton protein RodZ